VIVLTRILLAVGCCVRAGMLQRRAAAAVGYGSQLRTVSWGSVCGCTSINM